MSFTRLFLRHLPRRPVPAYLRTFTTSTEGQSTRVAQSQVTGNKVRIVEVGPRDGLQNEQRAIALETKLELIRRLATTGLTDIEAGSFVAPKWTPQMANSGEILDRILNETPQSPHPINYSFLAPNLKGFETAMSIFGKTGFVANKSTTPPRSPVEEDLSAVKKSSSSDPNIVSDPQQQLNIHGPNFEFSIFTAATETFTQKNLNCDIATSLARFEPVIRGAKAAGFRVRAYISVVLGCPFEGYNVDPHKVAEIATELLEMGADEIDLGDTTGMGTAPRTAELLRVMSSAGVRNEDITMHFHDTYGQALVNTAVSLEHGIRTFDSSVGGLGGCPFSPGATGNVSTEDMVYFLESLGMETGVNLEKVSDIGDWITTEIKKPNASSAGKAVLGRRKHV